MKMEKFSKEELESERWKDIDGYDGMYQVSDLGRVRSHKSGEWRVMKYGKDSNGYLSVILYQNGDYKRHRVHRLVAQTFIHNDDESKNQINHIDECKHNNRVSNLEWCSASYNMTYNNIHHRRIDNRTHPNYIRDKVKYLYNPNLSISDNIELFKSNGIECSKRTLQRLRKDLGLTKKTTK